MSGESVMKVNISAKATFAIRVAWSLFILYCLGKYKLMAEHDVPLPRVPEWAAYYGPIIAFGAGPAIAGVLCRSCSGVILSVAGTMAGCLGPIAFVLAMGWAKPHEVSGSMSDFAVYSTLILICASICGVASWFIFARRFAREISSIPPSPGS